MPWRFPTFYSKLIRIKAKEEIFFHPEEFVGLRCAISCLGRDGKVHTENPLCNFLRTLFQGRCLRIVIEWNRNSAATAEA